MNGSDRPESFSPPQYMEWYADALPAANNYAKQFTRCESTANDVVSSSFVAVLQRVADGRCSFENYKKMLGYLFTVIRNEFRDMARRRVRRGAIITSYDLASLVGEDQTDTESVEHVMACFRRMSKYEQRLIAAYCVDGKSKMKTAEQMGINRNKASAQIHRALDTFRALYWSE